MNTPNTQRFSRYDTADYLKRKDALGPEFDLTNQMIASSTASDLSQTVRMKPNTCRKH